MDSLNDRLYEKLHELALHCGIYKSRYTLFMSGKIDSPPDPTETLENLSERSLNKIKKFKAEIKLLERNLNKYQDVIKELK